MSNAPITMEQIKTEIKRLIAQVTEREPEEISDTALFADELGVDSLMAMEVMITMDKRFHIDIPEEEFNKIRNVEEAVAAVQRYMREPGATTSAASV